jgi:hypothetical protein
MGEPIAWNDADIEFGKQIQDVLFNPTTVPYFNHERIFAKATEHPKRHRSDV